MRSNVRVASLTVPIAGATVVSAVTNASTATARVPETLPGATARSHLTNTTPIKHVVVIYQENHSYDEVLGALCQQRTNPCDGFTGTVTLEAVPRSR